MKVFGITGFKNSGKTTLVVKLIEYFATRGIKVSTVKRTHHDFKIDQPDTDSDKHRAAGAGEVLVCSNYRWALIHEAGEPRERSLQEMLNRLSVTDLILVEGYKEEPHPKLQVVRPSVSDRQMPEHITNILALVSDEAIDPKDYGRQCPVLNINNISEVGEFILRAVAMLPQQ